jgi:hypothetical protein
MEFDKNTSNVDKNRADDKKFKVGYNKREYGRSKNALSESSAPLLFRFPTLSITALGTEYER